MRTRIASSLSAVLIILTGETKASLRAGASQRQELTLTDKRQGLTSGLGPIPRQAREASLYVQP